MNSGSETAKHPMTTSPSLTRRILLAAPLLAFAALPGRAFAQSAADAAAAFVAKAGNDLTAVVNGPGSTAEKAQALQTIIDRSVDVAAIGRFCLGRFWRTATPEQQKAYVDLFHRVLVLNITGKVGDYQGVTIVVGKATQRDDGIAVTSMVNRPNAAPAKVDWLVSTESGSPRIIDVIAEGTSLRLTQRNDYASYMSRNGNSVAALIEALKKQAAGAAG